MKCVPGVALPPPKSSSAPCVRPRPAATRGPLAGHHRGGDPFVLEAVGQIADGVDDLVDTGGVDDAAALADIAVRIAKAQLVAERLTLSAAQRLFDTGGASATARALNLDRHWRNARTLASHSPLAYKAHATGNYLVNGTWPPANGYF